MQAYAVIDESLDIEEVDAAATAGTGDAGGSTAGGKKQKGPQYAGVHMNRSSALVAV